jgi:hypothetical protein
MSANVIDYPALRQICGFTNAQFKKIDRLYCHAASGGTLNFRTVNCDFEKGIAIFTFCKTQNHPPYLSFVIKKVGANSVMFELYREEKGRIAKSGAFDRVLDVLREEILALDN